MDKKTKQQVEENYQKYWAFLEKPDGSIDKDQLKLELMDFSDMMDNMSLLADLASGGKLSYPTYSAHTIMQQFEEELDEYYDRGYKDATDDFADLKHDEDVV